MTEYEHFDFCLTQGCTLNHSLKRKKDSGEEQEKFSSLKELNLYNF